MIFMLLATDAHGHTQTDKANKGRFIRAKVKYK